MKDQGWLDSIREETPIRSRLSLAEEAANTLREFILLEKLAPGTPISEVDLAAALGISRTPLREALRLLAIEGLIEYTSTRRAHVADPSFEELSQYIRVLGALEALAGEIACVEASDEEIDAIVRTGHEMAEEIGANEALESFQLDMKFHRMMVEASRNQPLIETHRQYNARLWRARFISSQRKTGRENTLWEHDQIAMALKKRDSKAIASALQNHHFSTIKNIKSALEKRAADKNKD